jgi:hypothetical protein
MVLCFTHRTVRRRRMHRPACYLATGNLRSHQQAIGCWDAQPQDNLKALGSVYSANTLLSPRETVTPAFKPRMRSARDMKLASGPQANWGFGSPVAIRHVPHAN